MNFNSLIRLKNYENQIYSSNFIFGTRRFLSAARRFRVPVAEIASIVAVAEWLHIRTVDDTTYTINFRLKDLEARLNPQKFVRLSRGTIANLQNDFARQPDARRNLQRLAQKQPATQRQPLAVAHFSPAVSADVILHRKISRVSETARTVR